MSYCTVVRDNSWHGSTFHFVFADGCAYLDVKVGNLSTGDDTVTTNCSFDGAGCLSDTNFAMPAEIVLEILQLVPNEKSHYQIPQDSELAKKLQDFYGANVGKVENLWWSDFVENGVVKAEVVEKLEQ